MAIKASPLMGSLPWYVSSGPGENRHAPDEINQRNIQITIGTSSKAVRDELESMFRDSGLNITESNFVPGEFPSGRFYDASDDDGSSDMPLVTAEAE